MNIRNLLALSLITLWLPACAIVDIREDVHYNFQGGQIAQPIFTQVVPGVTTRQWLIDNLGEPASVLTTDNGQIELIYQYEEYINSKTSILFLFYYRANKVVPRQLIFAMKDDVVSRIGPSYFATAED